MRNDSEAKVEAYLCERVKELGGLCIKLNPAWYVGIPDRMVLLPGGRIGFAELKRPKGGRLSVKQKAWQHMLANELGFTCWMIRDKHLVDLFLSLI